MQEVRDFAFYFVDQLRARRWLALGIVWAVCITGWSLVALVPDRYVSEARFHVDTTSLLTPLLKGISVASDDQTRDREVDILQRTLTSKPNLERVMTMTDLDKTVRSPAAEQDLLNSLLRRISVESQGPNLFLVRFTDNSPVIAKNVVQSLLTIFIDSSIGDKREDIKSARTFIDVQIGEYEKQLKAAEQRLADFKIQNVQFLSSSSQTFAMRMEAAQDALKQANFERDDATAELARLRQQLNATPQYLSVDSASRGGTDGEAGGSLEQRIDALQIKLDDAKTRLTPKHPDVIALQAAMDRLIKQRSDSLGRHNADHSQSGAFRSQIANDLYTQLSLRVADAESRAATAKRKFEEAQSLFDTLQARTNEAPKVEAELTNLNRDYEVLRTSYDTLLQRRESARIADAADSTAEPIQFHIIAAPDVPAEPSGPPRGFLNTLVLIASLVVGAGSIVLIAQSEDRVMTPDDLLDFVGSRVLGTVSALSFLSRGKQEREFKQFKYAAVGLAVAFSLVLVAHPNLSALTSLSM